MRIKWDPNSRRVYLRCVMIVSCAVLMMLTAVDISHAALDVSPGSASAIKGQSTRANLTWTITGETPGTWTSSLGRFENAAGSPIGSPTASLSITVSASGTGTVTESLLIPSTVINTIVQSSEMSFFYRRDFGPLVGGAISERLNINIVVSQAAGPVSLRRVELYFEEDGRRTNEITVKRNAKGFLALADLYVNGTGYIEGYWEVDGRRIENIREYASLGSKLTVRSSEIPGLPTFRPGLHSVRLVISNPAPAFTLPQIGYIVTAGSVKTIQPLHPLSPEDDGEVNGGTLFSWNPGAGAVYVLTFTGDSGGDVVLTAQTKDPDYQIPPQLLADRFTTGGTYFWQIQGYGADGELVSEGRSRKFTVVE